MQYRAAIKKDFNTFFIYLLKLMYEPNSNVSLEKIQNFMQAIPLEQEPNFEPIYNNLFVQSFVKQSHFSEGLFKQQLISICASFNNFKNNENSDDKANAATETFLKEIAKLTDLYHAHNDSETTNITSIRSSRTFDLYALETIYNDANTANIVKKILSVDSLKNIKKNELEQLLRIINHKKNQNNNLTQEKTDDLTSLFMSLNSAVDLRMWTTETNKSGVLTTKAHDLANNFHHYLSIIKTINDALPEDRDMQVFNDITSKGPIPFFVNFDNKPENYFDPAKSQLANLQYKMEKGKCDLSHTSDIRQKLTKNYGIYVKNYIYIESKKLKNAYSEEKRTIFRVLHYLLPLISLAGCFFLPPVLALAIVGLTAVLGFINFQFMLCPSKVLEDIEGYTKVKEKISNVKNLLNILSISAAFVCAGSLIYFFYAPVLFAILVSAIFLDLFILIFEPMVQSNLDSACDILISKHLEEPSKKSAVQQINNDLAYFNLTSIFRFNTDSERVEFVTNEEAAAKKVA